MLITHEREKLVEAITFFAHEARKMGKTKLFKLLYFLDFEHFKRTGRSVTGLRYNAWKMGPVPVALYNEIDQPQDDLAAAVAFEIKDTRNGPMLAVRPKKAFDPSLFSRRELQIMQTLVDEHRNATADEMVEATHLENLPWDQVWNKEGQRQAPIPYELAASADDRDAVMRVAKEREELLTSLSDESRISIL